MRDDHQDCMAGNIAESTLDACLHCPSMGGNTVFTVVLMIMNPYYTNRQFTMQLYEIAVTLSQHAYNYGVKRLHHTSETFSYIAHLIWARNKRNPKLSKLIKYFGLQQTNNAIPIIHFTK